MVVVVVAVVAVAVVVGENLVLRWWSLRKMQTTRMRTRIGHW